MGKVFKIGNNAIREKRTLRIEYLIIQAVQLTHMKNRERKST